MHVVSLLFELIAVYLDHHRQWHCRLRPQKCSCRNLDAGRWWNAPTRSVGASTRTMPPSSPGTSSMSPAARPGGCAKPFHLVSRQLCYVNFLSTACQGLSIETAALSVEPAEPEMDHGLFGHCRGRNMVLRHPCREDTGAATGVCWCALDTCVSARKAASGQGCQ